jgi:formylmethanofuran dehydrogenase subunit A
MSEPITLKQQVAFIRGTLDTHEQVCGVKVEMGRMTKADAQRRTEKLKAVLATLKKAEAAGGVAESAVKEMTPTGAEFTKASVMSEVHKCAKRNAPDCVHCASIANILDEVIGNK